AGAARAANSSNTAGVAGCAWRAWPVDVHGQVRFAGNVHVQGVVAVLQVHIDLLNAGEWGRDNGCRRVGVVGHGDRAVHRCDADHVVHWVTGDGEDVPRRVER